MWNGDINLSAGTEVLHFECARTGISTTVSVRSDPDVVAVTVGSPSEPDERLRHWWFAETELVSERISQAVPEVGEWEVEDCSTRAATATADLLIAALLGQAYLAALVGGVCFIVNAATAKSPAAASSGHARRDGGRPS